ncbi:hypothetical protein Tco_0638188 [Tanacetum coccineum]
MRGRRNYEDVSTALGSMKLVLFASCFWVQGFCAARCKNVTTIGHLFVGYVMAAWFLNVGVLEAELEAIPLLIKMWEVSKSYSKERKVPPPLQKNLKSLEVLKDENQKKRKEMLDQKWSDLRCKLDNLAKQVTLHQVVFKYVDNLKLFRNSSLVLHV